MKIKLLVIMAIALLSNQSYACEGHFYASIGAGKAGTWLSDETRTQDEWDNDNGVHALVQAGYRAPIRDWLWWGVELGHNSTFDKGWPSESQGIGEPELDYAVFKLEIRR